MSRNAYVAALVLCALMSLGTLVRAEEKAPPPAPTPTPTEVKECTCVLTPTDGNKAKGMLKFSMDGDKLKIVGDVEGLEPESKHAIHIHEFGDISSKDGSSAGGHFNPEGHQHGLPDKAERHSGDLGNLNADKDGKAHLEITIENATLTGKNAVIGRGVIVHAKVDDGGQPTGNAGGRIANGVIGVSKPK